MRKCVANCEEECIFSRFSRREKKESAAAERAAAQQFFGDDVERSLPQPPPPHRRTATPPHRQSHEESTIKWITKKTSSRLSSSSSVHGTSEVFRRRKTRCDDEITREIDSSLQHQHNTLSWPPWLSFLPPEFDHFLSS